MLNSLAVVPRGPSPREPPSLDARQPTRSIAASGTSGTIDADVTTWTDDSDRLRDTGEKPMGTPRRTDSALGEVNQPEILAQKSSTPVSRVGFLEIFVGGGETCAATPLRLKPISKRTRSTCSGFGPLEKFNFIERQAV